MTDSVHKTQPPDGQWGWMIVVAYGVANMLIVPVLQSFGLIYKNKFKEIGISATDTSLIINLASSFGMALGLFNGPLLNKFGYRKVAFVGGLIFSFGLMLTSRAESFYHFLITYSILTSMGMGLCNTSFSVALNTYFVKRRNKAAGIAMTITGLGPIILPQLVSFLLSLYGPKGCLLIISGLTTHIIASSLLLQPIKWHLIAESDEARESKEFIKYDKLATIAEMKQSTSMQNIYGFEMTTQMMRYSISKPYKSEVLFYEQKTPEYEKGLHKTSSLFIISPMTRKKNEFPTAIHIQNNTTVDYEPEAKPENNIQNEKTNQISSICSKLVNLFDFTLLKDPIYLNIMFGLSIAVFAEVNFSILTPFILNDFGYHTDEIATIMSTLAVTDLIFRFLSPFLGDFFKLTARIMYMISLSMLIVTRFSILLAKNYEEMLYVACCLGIAKGVRSVYMGIVIPSYVPIKRLPSASSIQMMTNGLILIFIGPIVGLIRDISGSYANSIIFINTFTAVTLMMWIIEMLIVKYNEKEVKSTDQ